MQDHSLETAQKRRTIIAASWVNKEHGVSVQITSIWMWIDEPSCPCKNARMGILYYLVMDNLSQSGRAAWGGRRGPGLLTSSRPWRDSRPEATASIVPRLACRRAGMLT